MVRAAAKNYNDVTVITSTHQYSNLINQLRVNNGKTLEFRKKCLKLLSLKQHITTINIKLF